MGLPFFPPPIMAFTIDFNFLCWSRFFSFLVSQKFMFLFYVLPSSSGLFYVTSSHLNLMPHPSIDVFTPPFVIIYTDPFFKNLILNFQISKQKSYINHAINNPILHGFLPIGHLTKHHAPNSQKILHLLP